MGNHHSLSLGLILLCNIFTHTSSATLFNSTAAAAASDDQLALLAFKKTITSDPYALLANWSSLTPLCSWIGVTCSIKHHRVTTLNISRFSLGGTIAPHVGNLSFLRSLDVSFNNFFGPIPHSLFNMPRLQMLHMEHNFLDGEISEEVGNLSSLVQIVLGNNVLSSNIPSDICSNTPLLKVISLSENQLSGEIPVSIWKCRGLEVLDLSGNQLNGSIPGEIANLTMLSNLFLGINNLQGSIPFSIFNMSTLKVLLLSSNHFEGTLPSNMGISLFNLEELSLSGNKFSGPIPITITNASKLTILEMDHNFFRGSIPDFGDLRLLRILRISGNNLTAAESTTQELGFFSSLTNCQYLETLEISENPLNGVFPAASIVNLSDSLRWFRAAGCKINGVIPLEIGNLRSLVGMYLSENQLKGHIPHTFCQMNILAELDLSSNMLRGPIPECFGEVEFLRVIKLGSNKLNSTIPSNFWDLNMLLTLNLSSNYLSGNLSPEIGNLKSINSMDLSFNQFSGDIPRSFDSCQSLETLSLSNNILIGHIPQSLGSVSSLSRLDLSNNDLSGSIPNSLIKLHFLEHFNVSYNKLDGEIPNEGPFINFTSQSFVNNSAFCGSARFQVPPCMKNHARTRSKKVALWILYTVMLFVSGILGAVVMFVLARIPVYYVVHHRPTRDDHILLGVSWKTNSYRDLVKATSGFSDTNLLGRGSSGSVYKGTLPSGLDIAVKVFNFELVGAAERFYTETEILSCIRHRNVIRVIGCCANADFRALVIAYMPNGSVEKLLYSDKYFLDLVQRLNIALDVALALEYLHHNHTFPIVHRDINPTNVLLDLDLTAHLADFGIAKLFDPLHSTDTTFSTFQGTIGYAPPEYGLDNRVSTMGDVYSYGIFLLEMFTRKKPTDDMFGGEIISLKEWVCDAIERNVILKVADPALFSTQDQHFLPKEWVREVKERTAVNVDPALLSTQVQPLLPKVLSSVFHLAMKCLPNSPDDRINMIEVTYVLQKIKNNVDSEMTRNSSPNYSIAETPANQTTSSQLLASERSRTSDF